MNKGFTFRQFLCRICLGDKMNQQQRYRTGSRNGRDDPYERGFAHKLYEDQIGADPYYETNTPSGRRSSAGGTYSSSSGSRSSSNKKRKKGGFFSKCFKFLLFCFIVLAVLFIAFRLYVSAPMHSHQDRMDGVTTILVAGTDESGLNTDTLMLVNVDRAEGQISIMSIPRDTKVNSTYVPHKINGAYVANGQGEDGMFWLCDYVRKTVGFHPDAYALVDLNCLIELVDLFGGVEFHVPMDMHYEDPAQDLYIHLEEGLQTLDGEGAMGVVRFRKGYTMQDLERVNVQRNFLMSALSQWLDLKNLPLLPKAISILNEHSMTNLSTSNLLWLAESLLVCGTDDMMMTTIPHTLGSEYVYVKADDSYLELINRYFNPYVKPVSYEDLDIAN